MASGMTNILRSVQEITKNSNEDLVPAVEILLKFANNIIKDPKNEKYRKIRVGNPIVSEKLLPVSGAIECLFEMGFIEDGDFFTLPMETSLLTLKLVKDQLTSILTRSKTSQPTAASAQAVTAPKAPQPARPSAEIFASEGRFYAKVSSSFDHVLVYEDRVIQEKARSKIPIESLEKKATSRHTELNQQSGSAPSLRDLLLLELLAWFKKDFFKWVDAPPCDKCGGKTHNIGMVEPDSVEKQYGAGRVENYLCSICGSNTRFPRYNHPGKLLDTKRGRCGEWANCFTLCCRAMGYEARYVLDWTDHVWTEVYSESQKRWLHCDSCENKCDKPLMYEAGWGKKLTYIIAFSKDDIQDVTWRYSIKHSEVLARRRECRENWLVNLIVKLRNERQKGLGDARKLLLGERLIREMAELVSVKDVGEGEMEGRESGSLAWRTARGETGSGPKKSLASYVLTPTDREKSAKCIHVTYNCAKDVYVRKSNGDEEVRGWQSCVNEAKNVMRKEEHDWGMVYLARKEGTDRASLTWKIDLEGSGLVVQDVDIQAESACYEDGIVTWRLCSPESCAIIPKGQSHLLTSDLAGSVTLTLVADLRKGRGDCAWQHTQVFRQKMDDGTVTPFSIKLTLREK